MGDEIVALSREFELKQETEWGRSFQGAALAALGQLDRGIDQLEDSLAVQQAIGSGLVRTAFLALLGEMLLAAGRLDEGLRAIDEGFAHGERTLEGGYLAELHRVRGELLQRAGDLPAAEASLGAAVEYATGQQAKSFELRASTALAKLLLAAGRRDEARATLAPVYGWFTEGHTTRDLARARETLTAIG
jgi:predicted ATPase